MGLSRPINVGKYRVSVEIPEYDSNDQPYSQLYKGVETTQEFTISPIPIIVIWGESIFTYNGETQKPSYTISSLVATTVDVSNIPFVVNVTTQDNPNTIVDPINVEKYIATASVSESNNFKIDDRYTKKSYSIQQREIVISANQIVNYTGDKFTLNYNDLNYPYYVSNLCTEHTVVNSPLRTISHVVGTYTASGNTISDFTWLYGDIDIQDENGTTVTANYALTYNMSFVIDYSKIQASVKGYTGQYDGEYHSIEITVDNELEPTITYAYRENASDSLVFKSTNPSFKDVYIVGGEASARTIYYRIEIEGRETLEGSEVVFITKKQAGLSFANGTILSKVYDGENVQNPDVTYVDMVQNPRTVTYTYYRYTDEQCISYTLTDTTMSAGFYKLVVTLDDGSDTNYVGGSCSTDFVVQKRDVKVAVKDAANQVIPQSKIYDGLVARFDITNSYVTNLANYSVETFTGVASTKSAVVGTYRIPSDFNLTYSVKKQVQNSSGQATEIDVTENYNVILDLYMIISPGTIIYTAENVDAVVNGYNHYFEVDVEKPINAVVWYKVGEEEDWTTQKQGQKTRGQKTVYYKIEADNYTTAYGSGLITVHGISSNLDLETSLIYDETKEYDTQVYMYNTDVKLSHPRIVTDSTGNQTVRYFKSLNQLIVTIVYDSEGGYVEGDLSKIPTNAGTYLLDVTVAADGTYEEIAMEAPVSFKITKIQRDVVWEETSQTYCQADIKPTAYYINYANEKIYLNVTDAYQNAGEYQVAAQAQAADLDTQTNYILLNDIQDFVILPIEVDELNLDANLIFEYYEQFIIEEPVYELNEETGEYELVEYNERLFDIGDIVKVIDVVGNVYILDENNNIIKVENADGEDITETMEEDISLYTVTIYNDGQADRKQLGGAHKFTVSLKDKNNYIWTSAQNSDDKDTTFVVNPFDLDKEDDDYSVHIVVPSYVLYTGSAVKPEITVSILYSDGTTLRTLSENTEYVALFTNNTEIGKNAQVTIKGIGNFEFEDTQTFEIRAKEPERFELTDNATIRFVQIVANGDSGKKFDINAKYVRQENNDANVYLAHLHQSQKLADIMNQFVRYDVSPNLFRVFDHDGNLVEQSKYSTYAIRTGLTIRMYENEAKEDDDYVDSIETILYGDMDCNGVINQTDMLAMKKLLKNNSSYDDLGIQYLAGLTGESTNTVNQTNLLILKKFLGKDKVDYNANYLTNVEE